jgi:hypothetical protein
MLRQYRRSAKDKVTSSCRAGRGRDARARRPAAAAGPFVAGSPAEVVRMEDIMAVTLNRKAFDHAKALVNEGKVVRDNRDAWSEHRPTAQEENAFISTFGYAEYGKWHLGIDDEEREDTKAHYKFPYGDFKKVHRCAVLSAESRAGQYKYQDIENAIAHLHGMIDAKAHA